MTQEDWKTWRANPVTQEYRRLLEAEETDRSSAYNPQSVEATALMCAYNTGWDNGLECALTIEPEWVE